MEQGFGIIVSGHEVGFKLTWVLTKGSTTNLLKHSFHLEINPMSYEALDSEQSDNSTDIPVDALKKLEGLELKDLNTLLTFNAITAEKAKSEEDTNKLDAAFDALANLNVNGGNNIAPSGAPPMRGIDRLNSININPKLTSAMFAALAVSKSQNNINGADANTGVEMPDIWKNTADNNVELGKEEDERDQLLGNEERQSAALSGGGGLQQQSLDVWTPDPATSSFIDKELESSNFNKQLHTSSIIICMLQVRYLSISIYAYYHVIPTIIHSLIRSLLLSICIHI